MVSFLFWGSVALQGLWYPPGTITYPGPTERDKEQKNSTQEYRLGKGYVDRSQESVVFLFRKEFFFSYLKQQNSSKFHQGHVSTKPWKFPQNLGQDVFFIYCNWFPSFTPHFFGGVTWANLWQTSSQKTPEASKPFKIVFFWFMVRSF